MKRALASTVLLVATLAAWANEPKADQDFVTKAGVGGLAEVEMGKLALKNGDSQSVKDFGKKLVDDHSKANDELARAAKLAQLTVPKETDAEHKQHLDMLGKLKGKEFDRAFATHMVEGHEKMLALFRAEVDGGKADSVRSFAKATVPTLEEHLRIAQGLAGADKPVR